LKPTLHLTLSMLAAVALASCGQETTTTPQPRMVRAITVKHAGAGETISLTGQVQARDQVNLAFRVSGRLLERTVSVGDKVITGQLVARLEAQDALNALQSAEADHFAAQATLAQAQASEARQRELVGKGSTTRAQFDQALQQLQTAQAHVASAQARLRNARDNLGYTELRSDVAGVITAKAAEPGEVVQSGQMILQVAQHGGRDAVFNVPAQLIRIAPKDPIITVALSDDPNIAATGRVREVAPQADPVTGTYLVKIALQDPPDAIRLGATVIGSLTMGSEPVVQIPGPALTQSSGKPAVWVVDPASRRVSLREVTVLRYDPASVIIADGLGDDEIVVTAGVQALRPNQEVRLPEQSASVAR
jgi:RND family efflux transporter MFP subunit